MVEMKKILNHSWEYTTEVSGENKQEVEDKLNSLVSAWNPVYFPKRTKVSFDGHKFLGQFSRAKSC